MRLRAGRLDVRHALRAEVAPALAAATLLALALGCAGGGPGGSEPGPTVVVVGPLPSVGMRHGSVPGAAAPVDDRTPPIVWEASLESARERARAQARRLLVFARADWLAAALRMEREIWTDARVRRAMQPLLAVKLDLGSAAADAEVELERLGVSRLPALVLLEPDGRLAGRIEGSASTEQVLELLATAAGR
ncbi:MAG: thioredoxin family protein [Deltaproteobacteria bacterium]|nr:thioredoxin family protein [Deltaproteobacteria bacterium]